MAEQIAKTKKKQWYQILAPKQFNNVVLGETIVADPQRMMGKTLKASLMHLANDMKKQNVNIIFKVSSVDKDKANTSIIGYELVPSSVKRLVRRKSEKMYMSMSAETADNVSIRIKPLVITRSDVKGSISARLRNMITLFLIARIKTLKYEELLNELMSHKIQIAVKDHVKKIYPLKICEIKYAGIEVRDRPQEVKVEVQE